MSRRFRICVAKWGRGCKRPIYGRPKFTLFSKKVTRICGVTKKRISQNLRNWALKLKSLLPIDYGKKWFKLGSSNSKIVGDTFFSTPHDFANGLHFVALTQHRTTKTGSNICCTHLSYTFSESWVRKDSVGTCPEKFSHWKFSGTERFTKKFHFSLISLAASKKKVSGSCTHNFDATDLPNS